MVQAIVSLPLGGMDTRCWENEPAGTCRFKTLYKHLLPHHICPSQPWKVVWQLPIIQKLKIFFWQLLQNKLSTRDRLSKWMNEIALTCPLCRSASEST